MRHFAIFSTDERGQEVRIEHVCAAEDVDSAMEDFAEDKMSTGRSVEAGWEWAVYQIPNKIVGSDELIYDFCEYRSPTIKETPAVS